MLEQEPEVNAALAKLTVLLQENDVIQRYQELKQRADSNQHLQELQEKIERAQKDIVQFQHYDKPEAHKAAVLEADRLTREFDTHPLVMAYREQLVEANDLLQHLTNLIQTSVNEKLEEEK